MEQPHSLNGRIHYCNLPQEDHLDKPAHKDEPDTRPPVSIGLATIMTVLLFLAYVGIYWAYLHRPDGTFYQIWQLDQVSELPFCLVVMLSQAHSSQTLHQSINQLNYSNYTRVLGPSQDSYEGYRQLVKSKCITNSIVMFVSTPLQPTALHTLNQQLSYYKAWAVYTRNPAHDAVEVAAFYYRIYELLAINDFKGTHRQSLASNDRQDQAMSILELCTKFKREVERDSIYATGDVSYFNYRPAGQVLPSRVPYTKILRLSQDFDINIRQYEEAGKTIKYFSYQSGLGPVDMRRALDRQDLLYLPHGHPIERLEQQQFCEKYGIHKYSSPINQVRFCVTVLTRNNAVNRREEKVLMSILQQQYENYHIVFIDDHSDDGTMRASMEFLRLANFPRDRITFVQNLQRNYATYNIINAAFTYCDQDDVQMLIDGDDEFIGRYAFQTMNAAYQSGQDIWIAYANYKTNLYSLGLSKSYKSDDDHIKQGKRRESSVIGPIRTWRVKLIRAIPLQYHKFKTGAWIDTAYDDSLAHPLVELARHNRTRYVPQVLYEYNTNTGQNDNSNEEKLKHRREIYTHILSLPVLDRLQSLDTAVKDREVERELRGDRGVRYTTVQP